MLGLYVHIPFCRSKCAYCSFYSVKYSADLVVKYIESILKEIESFGKTKINSIYIGGGTPSILSEKQISKLLNGINCAFNLQDLKEQTFELNPESASLEKLKILKSLNTDRLSFGLQSCNNQFLKILGRVHTFEDFQKAYRHSRIAGFKNINIDLIYGIPGQSRKDWIKTLNTTLRFEPEHLSLYPLSVEKGTAIYKNGIKTDEGLQRQMYEDSSEILDKKNFVHYEISNWSKAGKEALHNLNYWRNGKYIGIGAAAAGYLGGKRYKNIEDIKKYIDGISSGFSVKEYEENIDEKLKKRESIMLGLRLLTEGADIANFDNAGALQALDNFLKLKMLKKSGEKITLAKDYVFVSNSIISEFIME